MTAFDHFVLEQTSALAGAMAELRAGHKRGHWIWFVFPQLAGLGTSSMAQRFALASPASARAYLQDPLLGPRYQAAVDVVYEQICHRRCSITVLMGSHIDALKLVSSLTLFADVAEQVNGYDGLTARANAILDAVGSQGFERCQHTLNALDDP